MDDKNGWARLRDDLHEIKMLLREMLAAQQRAERHAEEMEKAYSLQQEEQMQSLLLAMGGAKEWKP